MGVVNQFMINLEQSHWIATKKNFHYFKGTMDFGMCFKKNIKDVIMGKVHSDKNVNHCRCLQVSMET